MRSSKTNDEFKHLLIADTFGDKGTLFYSRMVYRNSVGADDKTY
jgi:hypothetical protein